MGTPQQKSKVNWDTSPEDALRASILSADVAKGQDVAKWNVLDNLKKYHETHCQKEESDSGEGKYSIIESNPYDVAPAPSHGKDTHIPVLNSENYIASDHAQSANSGEQDVFVTLTPKSLKAKNSTFITEPVRYEKKASEEEQNIPVLEAVSETAQQPENALAIYTTSESYFDTLVQKISAMHPDVTLVRYTAEYASSDHAGNAAVIINMLDEDESELLEQALDTDSPSLYLLDSRPTKKCLDKIAEFINEQQLV